jgi:pimeloyl-ACP methyl ester carboxylesterase
VSTSTTLLAFQSTGPDSAPTIVFLHGGGAGGWMWEPVIQLLPDYHCLAPDQPETGGSREIKPFSMGLAAQKTAELIRAHAHGGKAIVVGLSEGAQVAVQLLATAPEVVEKAIITSALLRPIPGLGWINSPALIGWMYRISIPPFRNADWWIKLNMKYAAGIPNDYFPQFKNTFQTITESEFVNMLIANETYRLPAGLERATAATLALAGVKEYPVMKQSVRDLVSALPNARGGWINLAGTSTLASQHNWALIAPDLFAATVRAWIENTLLPSVIVDVKG